VCTCALPHSDGPSGRKAAQERRIPNREGGRGGVSSHDDGRQIITTPPSLSRRRGWGFSAEPLPREWCTDDKCLYEVLLAAEGYGRSVVTEVKNYEEEPK